MYCPRYEAHPCFLWLDNTSFPVFRFKIFHISLLLSVPNVKFDHQRAGEKVCVSTDGMRITTDKYALSQLGNHLPGSARELKNPATVLGKPLPMTGLLYWEVAIAKYSSNEKQSYSLGVVPSTSPLCRDHVADDVFRVVVTCAQSIIVEMMHKDQCLHKQILCWRENQSHYGFGLLMDIDNCTLSVSHNTEKSCRHLYTFKNVDTSKGVMPIFKVVYSAILSLVDPNLIQFNNLGPLFVKYLPWF